MKFLLFINFIIFLVFPISMISCAYRFHSNPNIPMKNGAIVKSKVDGTVGVVINGPSFAYPEYRTVRFPSNKSSEDSNKYFTLECYVWELEELSK